METPFETGPARYQPPSAYRYAHDPKLRFDQRRLARVVGLIALGMPIVLGDIFVGCLIAIAALLMAYRGWTPKVAQLATLAGAAALIVALVPMSGWAPGCSAGASQIACDGQAMLYPVIGNWIHAGAAGILFAILAFFCLFVFTKIPSGPDGGPGVPSLAKRRRNVIYRTSGVLIAGCAVAIGIGGQSAGEWWLAYDMTFWLEAVILSAFGVSWLTQGRALVRLEDPRDREDEAIAKAEGYAARGLAPPFERKSLQTVLAEE